MREKKIVTGKDIRKHLTGSMFSGNRFLFWTSIISNIGISLISVVFAYVIQQIIDIISSGAEAEKLLDTAFEVVLILLGCAAVIMINALAEPAFKKKAMSNYKTGAFKLLTKKGISSFSNENTSSYISAFSNDAKTVRDDYLNGFFLILQQSVWFIASFALMLFYNPLLTLIAFGAAALPIIVSVCTGNRLEPAQKAVSEANSGYTATLKDALTGFPVIKSFKAENEIVKLINKNVRDSETAQCRCERLSSILSGIGSCAAVISQMAVFLVGAWLSISGHDISGGTVMAFVQLMGLATSPIGSLPGLMAKRKAAKGLITKLSDSLAQNVADEGEKVPAQLNKSIELKNVTFGYEENKTVLNNLSATFEAGKSYAIVGGSGSGKSTLLNLLLAGSTNYSGEISFDNRELKNISTESLYDMVSLVQQNVFVFNNSIRDNITMFGTFAEDDINRSIKMSGLTKLISDRGDNYLCGENGSGLSGGERQRISIARALLRKNPVLMFDEATAALDAETAHHVSDSILNLDGLTRIVVTHSLDESLLSRYDRIMVLKNGTIGEEGSFDELMSRKGYFYSLYNVAQ